MEFTIKNLKHSDFASQETHCFEATLYIDGEPFCKVSNAGHGGSDNYATVKGGASSDELWKRIREINAELSKETVYFGGTELENCLELVVGDLVDEKLLEKSIKNILKKVTYVDHKGDLRQLSARHKPSQKVYDAMRKSEFWNEKNVILNELPIEEVKQHVT